MKEFAGQLDPDDLPLLDSITHSMATLQELSKALTMGVHCTSGECPAVAVQSTCIDPPFGVLPRAVQEEKAQADGDQTAVRAGCSLIGRRGSGSLLCAARTASLTRCSSWWVA